MRTLSFIFTIAAVLLFSSCRKNDTVPQQKEDINTWLKNVKDSCSYTIDGKVYTCNQAQDRSTGNSGMNLDTSNGQWKWHPDSVLYSREFVFSSTSNNFSDYAYLDLVFTKKYGKNQLIPVTVSMLRPATDLDLYGTGFHKFATEFHRFNNDEGVVLTMEVNNGTVSSSERLSSVSEAPVSWPTAIGPQSHANSKFEIIKVEPYPNGKPGYVIEARFSGNVFNKQEQAKRVENGYVRFKAGNY